MMITDSNLKEALLVLGFTQDGNMYEKRFAGSGAYMGVDLGVKKLRYPEAVKGSVRNEGFDKPENFVVFECVNRLLEKGYRPEHIELEKEWHLGHDSKSGRADICVVDENGVMLFIIECKTWGREFDKAFNNTKKDGAQLFSYWQQEQSCRWLSLYSSDLEDGHIVYKAPTINCSDDPNILLLSKKDNTIRLYCNAHTTGEKYDAWKETYGCQILDDLIFSDASAAYKVGVKPLLKRDLQDFKPEDKTINKFEEILRHNNVSDKENAFNRLIALFICKLVDESTKGEDDEVEFQYKQGTDTYETLQDRLQRLHHDGMDKFMREETLYVPDNYPEQLFSNYTGQKRKKAIEDLRRTFRILKFYSNNDFAFKDVHNEELFYQNGKILVEMVQLFEKYRIVYRSKHQFLGDLFEQLLSKGFKQNEGQFFTPVPITRFIWDCLPIKRIIKSDNGAVYPKVIDYACGAGHFLTEGIEAINYFAGSNSDNEWVRDHIYGIEKDYRLARVSKISLFMNGAGEGNVIFGDGLENAPDKGIVPGTFDILVANPPYAVKDFKQHLQLKNNTYTLLEKIRLNGKEIETLFVERIGQLLKPKGVAAVILPSAILSNESGSYVGAREQLLQNFYIRAIALLGSRTFGATSTNTVIMFLEKFNEPPKRIDLSSDSVDAIMEGAELTDWEDREILGAYLKQIGVEENAYKTFLDKELSLAELRDIAYFKMYADAFADSPVAKKLQKTRAYKNKGAEEQTVAYLEKLYEYALSIEREKLFYFSLVYQQITVVITVPEKKKGQEDFLGYKWSGRKGYEGIHIVSAGGKMYDDSNREAENTLACAVRQSFAGAVPSLSEEQKKYASIVNTKDMLDFSRVIFNKTIRLAVSKADIIYSKYPLYAVQSLLMPLRNLAKVPQNEILTHGKYPVITQEKEILISGYTDNTDAINDLPVVVFGDHTCTFKYVDFPFVRGADGTQILKFDSKKVLPKFSYYFLKIAHITNQEKYERHMKYLKDISIPVPPIPIQRQIIDECEKIDEEYNTTRMSIESYRKKIEELFNELDVISSGGGYRLSLANFDKFEVRIGKRVLEKQLAESAQIPVYSANVKEPFGFIDTMLISDFSVPSVLWGIDGDWMTNYIPKDIAFYPTDHCGMLRCKTDEVNPQYLEHILKKEGIKMGFSRSYRASIDRVRGITFMVADRRVQDRTVAEVENIEMLIQESEKRLKDFSGKIGEILSKYLLNDIS